LVVYQTIQYIKKFFTKEVKMKITELTRNATGHQRVEKPYWVEEESDKKVEVNAKPVGDPFCVFLKESDIRETPNEHRQEKIGRSIAEDSDFPKNADSYISGGIIGPPGIHDSDIAIIPVQAYKVI
jgi:hypothetical protein